MEAKVTRINPTAQVLKTIPRLVDQVCNRGAEEIEALAKQVLDDAGVVSSHLMTLAANIREQGRTHADHTTGFCNDLDHTLATVQKLLARHSGQPTDDDKIIDEHAHLPRGSNIPENSYEEGNGQFHGEDEGEEEHPRDLDDK